MHDYSVCYFADEKSVESFSTSISRKTRGVQIEFTKFNLEFTIELYEEPYEESYGKL